MKRHRIESARWQSILWNVTLEQAPLSRRAANLLKADVDLVSTAGMLLDLVLLLITSEPFKGNRKFTEHRDTAGDLASLEMKEFSSNHTQSDAQITHAWRLSDESVCCAFAA